MSRTHLRTHADLVDIRSGKAKMFDVIMETIDLDLPAFMGTLFSYAANPGLIIPAVLLMVYVCRRHGDAYIFSHFLENYHSDLWCIPLEFFE